MGFKCLSSKFSDLAMAKNSFCGVNKYLASRIQNIGFQSYRYSKSALFRLKVEVSEFRTCAYDRNFCGDGFRDRIRILDSGFMV